MTDDFIPRNDPEYLSKPTVGRQLLIYNRIKRVLKKYIVKGTEEQVESVTLEIWRETRR